MAGFPPPYPPPGPPFVLVDRQALKYQRRMMRDQAKAQREQYRYQMRAMRRRSMLGPVLAVMVGVFFLLVETGHLRSARLWELYGRWWPLLLVAGGVVLLVEWGIDQTLPRDPQQPYMRRSVGGGVITLIVLLALGGAAASGVPQGRDFLANNFSLNPDDIAEFLGSKHESDQTMDQAFPEGGSLTVSNPHGDVTISGTSSDGQVHLSLHKQVYSSSDTEADRKAQELSPHFESNGKLLSLNIPSLNGAAADAVLSVPATASITVNANHGDVHVDAVRAPLTVTANHGEVALSEIGGAVTAHGNHGGSSFSAHRVTGPLSLEGRAQDVTLSDISGPVSLSGDFYGTTHLEHLAGLVKFHTSRTDFELARLDGEVAISPETISADQATGPVVLTTRNRNINLERISGQLSVTNRNGTVSLTSAPPLGNVTVQNRNGSVTLTLPERADFAVSAETNDGDVENDFSLPAQQNDNHKTLNGTVGKGGSLIRINTSQGDVAVRKASIAALSPQPPSPPVPPVPAVSINGGDGSSVYVGKDGVRIVSGADGSSVIVGKSGLKITASPDGSSVYKAPDGTQLTEGADGSKIYVAAGGTRLARSADGSITYSGVSGTRYTKGADGSVTYHGGDGTTIQVQADGNKSGKGANGSSLTDSQIRDRLRSMDDELRRTVEALEKTEHRRDAERREHLDARNNH